MKFGASTFIWASPFSPETFHLVDKVKAFGFDILEICIEDPRTIPAAETRAYMEARGIQALVCGAFGPNRDISSEDSHVREEGLAYIRTCVDFAVQLGSPLVSGPMYAATGKTRLLTPAEKKQQLEWTVENLKAAADYAGEKGVKLAIEPLNRFETDLINTVEQGVNLLERVNHSNVGFLLDTFHMNLEEKSIGDAIRAAGKHILNFHSCENDRGIPGTGHIPWEEVSKALQDIQYDGYVVIEAFTTDIKEIARAVSQWRPLASSQDAIAAEGITFLKSVLR
ncbi:sugar phosphate isomerase/epimerase [Paenibacillus validus]|uniref:sugar phosphate isomerase/epimerase family protein n=1 Tax=Paenibacillus TaxID=44249 RepID=UPI000FD6D41B|nr:MULTISPECIES: sugar phosphate isomerase/epimerase family protein [Paenibacillus]MED4599230.1 sugar phosphate isomerase/epimerase [Paenibacillus validus]MED4606463.1 sugar phosphate isomerase/epimerase [Paenibacillus validus]